MTEEHFKDNQGGSLCCALRKCRQKAARTTQGLAAGTTRSAGLRQTKRNFSLDLIPAARHTSSTHQVRLVGVGVSGKCAEQGPWDASSRGPFFAQGRVRTALPSA